MTDIISTPEDDNVIDFVAEYLHRRIDTADTDEESELACVMYEAYMDGAVLGKLVHGEMLFTLAENGPNGDTGEAVDWPLYESGYL